MNEPVLYKYEIIKENAVNGLRSGQTLEYYSTEPMKIDSLQMNLRRLSGCYRVLRLIECGEDAEEVLR